MIAFSWNAERLKYDIASRAFIGAVAPDFALLTEVDIGMARSGNRHTVRELAEHMGAGYVYALEFAELGLGDSREMEWHKDETNSFGYHGNAIVSRHTLQDPFIVRLDDGAYWFLGLETADQRRIGFRNAIGATIGEGDEAMVCVAAHFENRATPETRAGQAQRLIRAPYQPTRLSWNVFLPIPHRLNRCLGCFARPVSNGNLPIYQKPLAGRGRMGRRLVRLQKSIGFLPVDWRPLIRRRFRLLTRKAKPYRITKDYA